MPAECLRAAQRQLRQSTPDVRWSLLPMFSDKLARVLKQNVGYSRLLSGCGGFCSHCGSCLTGSQSIGLGAAPR